MKHLIIAVLMLMCVMGAASALTCTCGDVCVNTTGWWNNSGAFNASGVPIQDAVNNATAGETICVKDGTYNENVDVATRLTIRSENGSSVTTVNASDSTDHVFDVTVNYVNISGFTVENATGNSKAGIRLTGANYCNISYNDAIANWHGIYLYNSCGHNNITGNNASSSIQIGVLLHWVCSNNNVTDNVANSNNFHGFRIKEYGNYNLIKNNTAENNIDNGFYLFDSCNYNTIIDNTMNFNAEGIRVAKSCHDTNVSNNTLANNTKGFHIIASHNNSFTCNYVHNSTGHAFYLTNVSPAVPSGADSVDNNISYNNIITNGNHNATSGGWEWQFNTSQASGVDAKNNYWGTTISSEITASIGENTGNVAYAPFLTWYSSCAPGYRSEYNEIILYANEYALINNWTIDQTCQQVGNNITNTVCLSYYNYTSGLWEAYSYGRGYNANAKILKNCSAFVFVDGQTTVSAAQHTGGVTIQNATWFYGMLPGSTAKTLTEIETKMDSDGLDVWSLYGFLNATQAYTNTGSYSVEAGEGYAIYVNTTGEYIP
jgi:parallel beta-helix repeat protein